jgi:hypothetical protein
MSHETLCTPSLACITATDPTILDRDKVVFGRAKACGIDQFAKMRDA